VVVDVPDAAPAGRTSAVREMRKTPTARDATTALATRYLTNRFMNSFGIFRLNVSTKRRTFATPHLASHQLCQNFAITLDYKTVLRAPQPAGVLNTLR
jgi:hypothetical protein